MWYKTSLSEVHPSSHLLPSKPKGLITAPRLYPAGAPDLPLSCQEMLLDKQLVFNTCLSVCPRDISLGFHGLLCSPELSVGPDGGGDKPFHRASQEISLAGQRPPAGDPLASQAHGKPQMQSQSQTHSKTGHHHCTLTPLPTLPPGHLVSGFPARGSMGSPLVYWSRREANWTGGRRQSTVFWDIQTDLVHFLYCHPEHLQAREGVQGADCTRTGLCAGLRGSQHPPHPASLGGLSPQPKD